MLKQTRETCFEKYVLKRKSRRENLDPASLKTTKEGTLELGICKLSPSNRNTEALFSSMQNYYKKKTK
jgi:hypothetical protein